MTAQDRSVTQRPSDKAIEHCPWKATDHMGERRYNHCTWCEGFDTAWREAEQEIERLRAEVRQQYQAWSSLTGEYTDLESKLVEAERVIEAAAEKLTEFAWHLPFCKAVKAIRGIKGLFRSVTDYPCTCGYRALVEPEEK